MKKLFVLFVFGFLLLGSSAKADNWGGRISFNYFYTTLSPHGEWIELEDGLLAWQPYSVGRYWQPYTVGRWVWSRYGWYWDSYEPFGWAVYHYGRWYNDEYYGWIWIPDYDWGPAWVEWRYNDDYIGWAPLPPYAVFRIDVGIHFTYNWHFPARHWNYVDCRHFYDYDIHNYLVPDRVKYRVFKQTRYRTNYDYRDGRIINHGVDRRIVERGAGRAIVERNMNETTRLRDFEGSRSQGRERDRIQVFRPNQQEVSRSRDVSNINIKKSDRRTSLDVSKVGVREMSREVQRTERQRETPGRNTNPAADRGNEEIRRERNERNEILKTEPRGVQSIPDTRKNQEKPSGEMERRNAPETKRWNTPVNSDRMEQENQRNQQPSPGMDRRSREESGNNSTEQRRERPVYSNPPSQNQQPQVRENRREERKQEAPGENRRGERQNNDNTRERRR